MAFRCVAAAAATLIAVSMPAGSPASLSLLQDSSEASEPAIVVTGMLVRKTKVDYRLSGDKIAFCVPRDSKQERAVVRVICELARKCVAEGARKQSELSHCVNRIMAERDRDRELAE